MRKLIISLISLILCSTLGKIAPAQEETLPDLAVSSVQAPTSASYNQVIEVSWTVINQGNGQAMGNENYWADALYLSADTVLDPSDTHIYSYWKWQQPLAASSNYTTAFVFNMPKLAPGTYYLLLKTDGWPGPGYGDPETGRVIESNENNNVFSRPIAAVLPDLVVSSVQAPASISVNQALEVSWTVKNQGGGIAVGTYNLHRNWWATGWDDKVYLSSDTTLDNSDIELLSYEQLEQPLAPDVSYTATANLVAPKVSSGNYYLLIKTDAEIMNVYQGQVMDNVYESNDSNNVFFHPISIGAPDLVITSANITITAGTPQQDSVFCSWTVKNQGNGIAIGTYTLHNYYWWSTGWDDKVYLSSDANLDDSDTEVATYVRLEQPLIPAANYTATADFTVPKLSSGNYYVIIKTDNEIMNVYQGQVIDNVYESNEGNNIFIESLALPDLVVSNIDMPLSASAGQPISISWTVKNQDSGKAQGPWADALYLSADAQLDAADTYLANASYSGLLTAGNNYTITQTLDAPNVTAGNYYLILKVDSSESIYESQKWNNVFPGLISIGNAANQSEVYFSQSNLVLELLSQEISLTENATVSKDLNGTFSFTGFEIVSVNSGPFTGKGFFQGNWMATVENATYHGQLQGVSFLAASEKKIYLKGVLSGAEAAGIAEGYLAESIPDSGIYDQYFAVWKLARLGGNAASLTLNLEGKLSYGAPQLYPSTNIYMLQAGIEGISAGHYSEYINSVLTQLRVVSPDSPYFNRGFSTMSYATSSGTGEGWTYDNVVAPGRIQMNGMFTNPLLGILTGILDETKPERKMQLSIERIDLGSPPAPDLAVKVWGPERVSPGQTIDYVIEYRNDGLKAAANTIISCALDMFVKHISASPGVYYDPYAHELSWKVVNIPAKTKGYLTFKVEVTWGLPAGFSIEQNAYITNIGD